MKRVAISPDQTHIVSVGAEGAIFIWKTPQESFIANDADKAAEEAPVADPVEEGEGEANVETTTKVEPAPETEEHVGEGPVATN